MVRYNYEYTIKYEKEEAPELFCVGDLQAIYDYLFTGLLELYDLNIFPHGCNKDTSCPVFHVLPRFVRDLEGRC